MSNRSHPAQQFNVQKPCRYGAMLYNSNDVFIGISLEVYGEWCQGELDLLEQVLRPGDVVVDVGANIGTHAVAFARAVGPTGTVWAFEPQRVVFQTLCANMALNSLSNVRAQQMAVGAVAGSIAVPPIDYQAYGNFGAVGLEASALGEAVTMMRLDDLGLATCRLIKVDVEGMEQQVVEGAMETIQRHRPFLYVENERPGKSADLVRAISRLDYDLFWHVTPFFNPANFNGFRENIFLERAADGQQTALSARNMFCVPKEVEIDMPGFVPITIA